MHRSSAVYMFISLSTLMRWCKEYFQKTKRSCFLCRTCDGRPSDHRPGRVSRLWILDAKSFFFADRTCSLALSCNVLTKRTSLTQPTTCKSESCAVGRRCQERSIVYKATCRSCRSTYFGQTTRTLHDRAREHVLSA